MSADAFDHLGGGAPGHLVGGGGVEIGTTAEEESGEADEDKCKEGVPHHGDGILELRAAIVPATESWHQIKHDDGGSDDHKGEVEHAQNRVGIIVVGCLDGNVDQRDDYYAYPRSPFFPAFVHQYAQSVQRTPGDKVE